MRFISVDPGTYCTALVIWEGSKPIAWEKLDCPKGLPFEERLGFMVGGFQTFGVVHQVEAVAIERPFLRGGRPAPELNVLVRRLRQGARHHKWEWHIYHPSTVKASVRPRETQGWKSKDVIKTGVLLLYGQHLKELDQNVLDSIAVGHCHLSKQREEALTHA